MAKRGLGRGLGAFFGEEVTKEEIPAVKRQPKTVEKKEQNSDSATEHKETEVKPPVRKKKESGAEKKSAEPVVVEKIVEVETIVEKVVEKPVEQTLKIALIEPNSEQPRKNFDEEALKELADSIKEYGILQPLLVQKKDSHYEIIAGERRWRAAKLAGLVEVPVLIREYDKQRTMEIALIENVQRADLNPIEEALAYQRLIQEFDLTQEEIAGRVSKNRATITNSMRLLKLDPRVQQMLVDEQISSGHARALLAVEKEEDQYLLAQRVFDEKLSVREIEKIVRTNVIPHRNVDWYICGDYNMEIQKMIRIFGYLAATLIWLETVYHIGASIKDAGKKCFGITLIQDSTMANDLINRLKKIK